MRLITDDREHHADAVMRLGWCLDDVERQELATLNHKDVHVFIVVRNSSGYEDRYLVPIDEKATYIQFSKAGKNTIYATLVKPLGWEDKPLNDLHKALLRISVFGYDEPKTFDPDMFSAYAIFGSQFAQMNVTIEGDFFAKEPPKWLSKWVNFGFENAPRDQCAFRRRTILGLTLKPPAVLLFTLGSTFARIIWATISILLGRKTPLKPIWHPFSLSIKDIWEPSPKSDSRDSRAAFYLLYDKNGRERNDALFLLTPAFVIAVSAGAYFLIKFLINSGNLAIALTVIGMLVASFVLGIALVKVLTPTVEKKREARRQNRLEKRRREDIEYQKVLESISCVNGSKPTIVDLTANPSIRLRYLSTKAKVCKPFAKK